MSKKSTTKKPATKTTTSDNGSLNNMAASAPTTSNSGAAELPPPAPLKQTLPPGLNVPHKAAINIPFKAFTIARKGGLHVLRTVTIAGDDVLKVEENAEDLFGMQVAKAINELESLVQ